MSGDSIVKWFNFAVATLINPPDSGEAAPQPPSLYTQLLSIPHTYSEEYSEVYSEHHHHPSESTGGEKNFLLTKQKNWSYELLRIPNSGVFLSDYTGNPRYA